MAKNSWKQGRRGTATRLNITTKDIANLFKVQVGTVLSWIQNRPDRTVQLKFTGDTRHDLIELVRLAIKKQVITLEELTSDEELSGDREQS